MRIALAGFRGANQALHPLNLPDTVGVRSVNQNPIRGDLRPWRAPLGVATVPAGRKTIYRMGRDVVSDTLYWLSWSTVVHAVRSFLPDDTTERTYFTGDGVPKVTDNVMGLAGAPYPTASRILGVPRPATAPLVAASGGVAANNESRYYTYTYVTDKGEEGEPAPPSMELVCKTDDTVAITGIAPPPSGNYGINRIRIYRTQSGATGETEFFFLLEMISTLTVATDDGRALGEVMPSGTWLTPPADLKCLTGLWNGMMAGITGKSVRFCEPFKPYAWPLAYEVIPPDATPVALRVFNQQLLVLTTAKPVLVTGSSPDSMGDEPLEISEACVSERSAVSFGHGVVWACPDGLAYYGAGGTKVITNGIMTKDDWAAINPASIVAAQYEGAYLAFYTVGEVTRGFVIDPLNPTGIYWTDIPGDAVFFDDLQDQLYILDGVNIKKWDKGTALLATFRSKTTRTPRPVNFGAGELVADDYPVTVILDALNVDADVVEDMVAYQPTVYAAPDATTLRQTVVVNGPEPFRLGAGYTAGQYQMEIQTSGAVQGLAIAGTMQELAVT
jgi:hypothetical protein